MPWIPVPLPTAGGDAASSLPSDVHLSPLRSSLIPLWAVAKSTCASSERRCVAFRSGFRCSFINSPLLVVTTQAAANQSCSSWSHHLFFVVDLLGVKPAPNNGTHGRLNHLLRNPIFTPHHPKELSHPSECSVVGQRAFPVSVGCSCRTGVSTEMALAVEADVCGVFPEWNSGFSSVHLLVLRSPTIGFEMKSCLGLEGPGLVHRSKLWEKQSVPPPLNHTEISFLWTLCVQSVFKAAGLLLANPIFLQIPHSTPSSRSEWVLYAGNFQGRCYEWYF